MSFPHKHLSSVKVAEYWWYSTALVIHGCMNQAPDGQVVCAVPYAYCPNS